MNLFAKSALSCVAVVACVGVSSAQNRTVFPSDHTGSGASPTIPGGSIVYYTPFSNGVSRQMMVYDAWDVRIPNGRRIQRIGFVREQNQNSTGYPLLLKVQMGQTTRTLSNVSTTFDQNFASTPTAVYANAQGNAKVFALPSLGGATGVDIVWLPLDTPFTYDASKGLVIDFQVSANQNGNNVFAYYLDGATYLSVQRSFGQACRTSGGAFPALTSSAGSSHIGGTWYLSLSSAPATTNMALLMGIASYEPGLPLDAFGMTGCLLSVNPVWSGGFTTNSGGGAAWNLPVPNNRALFGGVLRSQALMYDVFANSFGWITSNGDEIKFGIQPQAALIYGSVGNAQATTGTVSPNFGLITIFEHN